MYCNHLYKPLKLKNMKNLILTSIFIISTLFSIAQEKISFATFNFKIMDVTKNPKVNLETIYKVGPSGKIDHWDGFNHYEVDLKKMVLIHSYVGEETGNGEKNKILNFKKTKDFYSFDAKDSECGKISYFIPRDKKSKYKLLIKYKSGKNTEVAFFDSSSFIIPL